MSEGYDTSSLFDGIPMTDEVRNDLNHRVRMHVRSLRLEALAISDTNNELAAQLSASQARRLSEAVKVLEEATQALEPFAEAEDGYPHFREDNEYADQHEFQIRDLRLAKGSLSRAKAFLATLGEET